MLTSDNAQIQAMAAKLNDVAGKVDAIDVRTAANALAAALPGSGISEAVAQAAESVEGAYLRVAQRYRQVATLSVDCANRLETTDDEYRRKLDALDVRRA